MYKRYLKRATDLFGSTILLVLLLPFMGIIGLTVFFKMGKPILFRQVRPGLQAKLFSMYKFRTMNNTLGTNGELLPDQLRIGSFGRFLRSTSLDELPELINVIKGDMSLIGPRPVLIRDFVFMDEQQRQRQSVRPGITGLAQVKGRNQISWEEKFKYDLQYIRCMTVIEDIRIAVLTFWKVIKREGITCNGDNEFEDYGDYLLRLGKISKPEYSTKLNMARRYLQRGKIDWE